MKRAITKAKYALASPGKCRLVEVSFYAKIIELVRKKESLMRDFENIFSSYAKVIAYINTRCPRMEITVTRDFNVCCYKKTSLIQD